MIFLAAVAQLSAPPEPRHDPAAKARAALGHLGLIIIALVTVFLTLFKL